MILSDEDEAKSLMNLGASREGAALRQRLTRTLLMVLPMTADIGALSREHGRRLLAAELIRAIETPESADARDDLATHVHKPRRPVEYDVRSRRRVPDVAPADAAAEFERASAPGRASRADRRFARAGLTPET